MATKFRATSVVEGDPDFSYLVNLSGALIPIAHIKLIGDVVEDIADVTDVDEGKLPAFGFVVMLTDSDFFSKTADNPQQVYDFWDTREEAEEQRRNLAIQVDDYYKKLLARK